MEGYEALTGHLRQLQVIVLQVRFVVNAADTEKCICIWFLTGTTTFEAAQNEANLCNNQQRNSLTLWSTTARAVALETVVETDSDYQNTNIVVKLPIDSLKSLQKNSHFPSKTQDCSFESCFFKTDFQHI